MVNRSKNIGTAGERAVVAYLREHGFPHAERRALAGAEDRGDITGTPGIVWEVKAGRAAETAADGLVADWLHETQRERDNARAAYGVLVLKRPGYGPSRAASWWAVWPLGVLAPPHLRDMVDQLAPVRMHLSTVVELLRSSGYGQPLASVEVTA